jgi:hypothetical protein
MAISVHAVIIYVALKEHVPSPQTVIQQSSILPMFRQNCNVNNTTTGILSHTKAFKLSTNGKQN